MSENELRLEHHQLLLSGTTGERFICDDCEGKQAAFDPDPDTPHTRLHTIVRVSEKVEEKEFTIEERLKLLEDELGRMRQLLAKLVERGAEGSSIYPLTKGDLQAAVAEIESAQPVLEEVLGASENA